MSSYRDIHYKLLLCARHSAVLSVHPDAALSFFFFNIYLFGCARS